VARKEKDKAGLQTKEQKDSLNTGLVLHIQQVWYIDVSLLYPTTCGVHSHSCSIDSRIIIIFCISNKEE
jgi:hypothetical protein